MRPTPHSTAARATPPHDAMASCSASTHHSADTVDAHSHLNPSDLQGTQCMVQGCSQEQHHSTRPSSLHTQGGTGSGHASHSHDIRCHMSSRRHMRITSMLQLRRGLLLVLLSLAWAELAARAPLIVNAYPGPGRVWQADGGRPATVARSSRLRTLLQGISIVGGPPGPGSSDGSGNGSAGSGSDSSSSNSSGSGENDSAPLPPPDPNAVLQIFTPPDPPAPPALTGPLKRTGSISATCIGSAFHLIFNPRVRACHLQF